MMKMRMTMTTEVRDSISCLRVATEPVITKGERKLREAGGLSDTSYLVLRAILHFDLLTYYLSLKIKCYLPPDVSKRFHKENNKEVRNYHVNDQNSVLYLLTG